MLPSHNWLYNSGSGSRSRTDFYNRLTHRILHSPKRGQWRTTDFTDYTDQITLIGVLGTTDFTDWHQFRQFFQGFHLLSQRELGVTVD